MMIKYRVHDVAKDLDVPNKEVLDILGKYVKEPKKHMTALEENELDIVFDRFTQDHAAQNFDAYFATRNAAKAEEKPKKGGKPKRKGLFHMNEVIGSQFYRPVFTEEEMSRAQTAFHGRRCAT